MRQERGEAQIPNLDLPTVAIDVDFVTSEVTVDDGRLLVVQILEAQEDLLRPLAHRPGINQLVPLPVVAQVPGREVLCHQVYAMLFHVLPTPEHTVAQSHSDPPPSVLVKQRSPYNLLTE